FFFSDAPPYAIYSLSLHDALPIFCEVPDSYLIVASARCQHRAVVTEHQTGNLILMPCEGKAVGHGHVEHFDTFVATCRGKLRSRSEEHTSELQSRENLVCRLLLEK